MLEEILKQQFLVAGSRADLVQVLHQFKAAGGMQQDALRVLTHMRSTQVSEQEDDKLLELLDLVTGFCSPHQHIW